MRERFNRHQLGLSLWPNPIESSPLGTLLETDHCVVCRFTTPNSVSQILQDIYFLLLLRKVLWFLQTLTDRMINYNMQNWIPIASCATLNFKPYSNFQRCATKRSRRDSVGFVKICTLTPTSDLVCTFLNTNFFSISIQIQLRQIDTIMNPPYNHYGINQCLAVYWENAWLSTQILITYESVNMDFLLTRLITHRLVI